VNNKYKTLTKKTKEYETILKHYERCKELHRHKHPKDLTSKYEQSKLKTSQEENKKSSSKIKRPDF
jgi:hypothetical protein